MSVAVTQGTAVVMRKSKILQNGTFYTAGKLFSDILWLIFIYVNPPDDMYYRFSLSFDCISI